MRQSNKRSRSKQNRTRSLGNIVNRVFDSSGPEGKVRGTPQQIIDKYLVLARDAQLSGDRVAAENFAQHAEHYSRMLHEAQTELAREAEARREQQQGQQQNQNRRQDGDGDSNAQGGNGGNGGGNANNGGNNGGNSGGGNERRRSRDDRRKPRESDDPRGDQTQTDGAESTLVETPESRADHQSDAQADATPDAAEAPAPKKRGRPRKPRNTEETPAPEATADAAPQSDRDAAE
jgi:hypothetical protein